VKGSRATIESTHQWPLRSASKESYVFRMSSNTHWHKTAMKSSEQEVRSVGKEQLITHKSSEYFPRSTFSSQRRLTHRRLQEETRDIANNRQNKYSVGHRSRAPSLTQYTMESQQSQWIWPLWALKVFHVSEQFRDSNAVALIPLITLNSFKIFYWLNNIAKVLVHITLSGILGCLSFLFHRPILIFKRSLQKKARKDKLKNFWETNKKEILRRVNMRNRMGYYMSTHMAKIKLNKKRREYKVLKSTFEKLREHLTVRVGMVGSLKKKIKSQHISNQRASRKRILKQHKTERKTRGNKLNQKQRKHTEQN
jgi:hypothetical protein